VITSLKKNLYPHLLFFVTIAVALAVYISFLSFGHISWDDPEMVFKNKFVKTFNLYALSTNHFVGNYIPVTMFVHALSWFFFGSNDAGHHLLNVALHILNGVLVYQLGKKLFKTENVSITIMTIFLLHPLQVESVGWISELKNILSTSFYIAGLLYYIRYLNNSRVKIYIVTVLFFVLGCLSKSSVVVFPLSLICVDIYFKQNFSWKFIINKIPFFIFSLVFGLLNIKAQTEDQFINYAHAFPIHERIGYAGFALMRYFFMFVAPINLSVIYPYPQNHGAAFVIGYFTLTALAFILYQSVKRKKYNFLALILFTLINLLLVLQFVPFGEVLYADRYMYIPVIGFACIFSLLFYKLNPPARLSAFALLTLLAFASFSRSKVWRSGITLYEDILKSFPNSFVALNSIGVEYMLKDNNEKAFFYLNKSIQAAPYNYKGFYNRGLFYLKNQKAKLAVESFNQSLNIYEYSKAYVGRASAYHMLGEITKAMSDANSALAIEKNNAKAHFVLGNCYNDLNKLDEALDEYNLCIKFNTDEPDFYFKRGIVYGKKQEFNKCVSDINICLMLDPTYYEAYYWRGVARINLKQNACNDFKIASRNNYQPAVDAFKRYCK